METERLYLSDSTRRRFEATVVDQENGGVVLDRTAFYPTGGGQPHDTGWLGDGARSWEVADVHGREPIVHVVAGAPPSPGTDVTGEVDWGRRAAHMRYHTAQHLLSAVLLDAFDAPTTGNQLYTDRARIDCEYARFTEADLERIEAQVRDYVEDDRPVEWYELSRARAEETLDPTRTRLDLLPAAVDPVRIVEIDGVDRTACAGTHVARTGAIGDFQVTGRETAGKGRERVRFRLDA